MTDDGVPSASACLSACARSASSNYIERSMAPCLVLMISLWVGGGRGMCVGESARGYYICVHVPSNRHLLLMVSQKCDAFASSSVAAACGAHATRRIPSHKSSRYIAESLKDARSPH
eukprot:scaffold26546_cov135-Isochrysis_galbana.AAC.2